MHPTPQPTSISASKVLGALSFALDLTDGQPMGHSLQTCVFGMRIAHGLGLTPALQSDLYYALLLKDAGCSSNSSKLFHLLQSDEIQAKRSSKSKDLLQGFDQIRYALESIAVGKPFTHRVRRFLQIAKAPPSTGALIQIRCERGASIARRIGFSLQVAESIASLDEHWDGNGHPMHLTGQQIPLLSRIMNLAQNLAVFFNVGGPKDAVAVLKRRSRRWFDPELVKLTLSLARQPDFFSGLDEAEIVETVAGFEPRDLLISLDDHGLDRICDAFAEVIDTKSPYTYRHSAGVAKAAVAIALQLEFAPERVIQMRRAALLHDIGKLAVPNSILEKPGKLTDEEWLVVRKHPDYTLQILSRIPGFDELSHIAASHHERLDGKGYFRNLSAAQLGLDARILAVADVYDALAAARPYRGPLPREKVFSILDSESPHALDHDCIAALRAVPQEDLVLPDLLHSEMPPAYDPNNLPALQPRFA